jgi:hypothetical protein
MGVLCYVTLAAKQCHCMYPNHRMPTQVQTDFHVLQVDGTIDAIGTVTYEWRNTSCTTAHTSSVSLRSSCFLSE